MASSDTNINLNDLQDQLKAIEEQCSSSSLVIYAPKDEREQFFNNLCRIYLDASYQERRSIRSAVTDKNGVLNCLLGYVYKSAEQVRAIGNKHWLQIGLAAAAIQQGGYDQRDYLLALAELYVTAEEVGLDPKFEVEAMGGGIPADFDRYAVVKSRRGVSNGRWTFCNGQRHFEHAAESSPYVIPRVARNLNRALETLRSVQGDGT